MLQSLSSPLSLYLNYLPASLVSALSSHPYLFIFLGLLFVGESILFPSLYLAIIGALRLPYVFAVMVAATVIADIFWYALGRGVVPAAMRWIAGNRGRKQAEAIERVIGGRELHVLFFSKFVYGTRTAVQILIGSRKVSFRPYLFVNIAGVIALGIAYTLIVYLSAVFVLNVDALKDSLLAVASVIILCLAAMHWIFNPFIDKK